MHNKIPGYLTVKKNITHFLIFTALFSMVFINIYRPFGSEYWKEFSRTEFFLFSGLIVIAGIGILSISRFIMYKTREKHPLTYWQYFAWMIVEIAVISLIYAFLTRFAFHIRNDFITIFSSAFLYTLLVLLLPYAASWLFFALRDTERVLDAITRDDNFVDFGSDKNDLIHFKDEKGTFRFSVKQSHLFLIESADNYVDVHYLNKGKLARFLLRNSLKNIEQEYASNILVRCHRSYMINLNKVRIVRKEKDGLFLEMDIDGLPNIPVSKTYSERVVQLLSKYPQ